MFGGFTPSLRSPNLGKQSNHNIHGPYLTQSFREQHQIDGFIRSSRLIKIVETEAQNFINIYRSSKRPEDYFNAIIIKLPFVYSDFLNHPLDLLHFVIEEPVQFADTVKYCVFSLLRDIVKDLAKTTESKNITNIDIDQVHVLIRFIGLPLQQDLCFQPHINLYRTGLTEVIGILSAVEEPEKVVIQSVWYCSTGCERNKIKTFSLDVPTCSNCRHPMNEYSKLRHTQNCHLIRILPVESIEPPHKLNKLFRAIRVRVLDHVSECQLILGESMESNNNLESLREISESQLEALLIYDSPPETPSQLPDRIVLNEGSNRGESNKCKNEDVNELNNFCLDNNGQFLTQINSQIDFSIFHNDSPNLNRSPNDYDDSIIVSTQYVNEMTLDAIEISSTLISKKNNNCTADENYSEFDKNMKNNNTKVSDSSEQYRKSESVQDSNVSNISYPLEKFQDDFEEIDNIFKRIDFEYLSSLEESYLNKRDFTREINRQCQTQYELERILTNPKEKIIASCPALLRKNPLASSSSQDYELYANILQDPVSENTSAKNIVCTMLNNINISDVSIRQNNMETSKNEIDEMFDLENILQKSCQNQLEINLRHIDGEYFSTDDNPTTSSLKYSTNIKTPDDSSIPFSVRQLYEIVTTKYSDFAFIYALSSQLCQDRVPMECFVMLKMSLLLSLVSIGNNIDRPPIPIVAITNDTYMTDYLMTNIGQLGSRFLGPLDDIKTFSNNNWIEADSILLARGGVYFAGDWTRLKLKKTETILKNLECSSVAVEKSNLSFPLETAIWTHWRTFKYAAKDQQMFNKFLKIFGIPIFVSDDNHEVLVDYTLEQASIRIFESTVDHLSINETDMRNFLVYISQSNVDLSPEAALLLKNYFVASRSNRQDCLSKQSYIMLKQFAESFAKLSMRKEVSPDDALAAIIMCEHFIENAFNSSDNSPPHFGNFTFIGTVDEYFIKFKKWLNSYLEKYTKE